MMTEEKGKAATAIGAHLAAGWPKESSFTEMRRFPVRLLKRPDFGEVVQVLFERGHINVRNTSDGSPRYSARRALVEAHGHSYAM